MTGDGGRPGDWRIQRGAGVVLLGTAVFLAVSRSAPSETLIATLVAFGLVLLGVRLPAKWSFPGLPPPDDEDKEDKK